MSSSLSAVRPNGHTRRTRIVCIGDTHNRAVKLPEGDVLIHAGDLTNQGSYSESIGFYTTHGPSFHNQEHQDPAKCLSLFQSSRSLIYLQHESATIKLTSTDGPGTEFTIFGSPYSPQYGNWAFMYPRSPQDPMAPEANGTDDREKANAAELWSAIPTDIDILVTHTPALSHCDDDCGCWELRNTLAKVRPRLHVCGHVHQARGSQRVRWDIGAGNGAAAELAVEMWEDPNPDPRSAKMSLVDLTARGGKRPLDFDLEDPGLSSNSAPDHTSSQPRLERQPQAGAEPQPGSCDPTGRAGSPSLDPGPSVCGEQSINPLAEANRAGRRETCVVNCAIMTTGWPHKGAKQLNKPIVVDIDLPVWRR
ncbi:hypothetical protein B0J18DRAFT_477628 [Chaetomium sp. MPI-SDFR-AT-0129]|nr:hypothetical protein B0J18DRAFT_477628 [Chaetomium sp. MPI-SDFR-AT-0129]